MRRLNWSSALSFWILVFVYIGFILYPIGAIVRESMIVNGEFSFENIFNLLSSSASAEAAWNSIWVSLLSVVFSLIIGAFLAFVFTQYSFPLRNILSRLAILPIALPPLVGVIAFLFVFGESGILPRLAQSAMGTSLFSLEGMNAIVAVHTYSFYVYSYLFVSTALSGLDASQLEAAQALGSSSLRTMRRVIVPSLKPALFAAAILTFMASMASFSAPLIFGGEKRFMTLQIYNAKLNGDLNVAAAEALGLTIISVSFFVLLKFVGKESGSMKSKGVARVGVLPTSSLTRKVLIGAGCLLLILELLPLITIIVISFAQEGSWTWQLLPESYTVTNYTKLFSDPSVFEPVTNSMMMSAIAVIVSVVIGVTAAYLVTKEKSARSQFVGDILATLPYAVPGTVVAIGLILAFNTPTIFTANTILVGTFWILPIAYFVRLYPLVVRSTAASLAQVDDALIEAAETFGATSWHVFRRIVLPMIVPGIVSGGLLVTIAALGEFVSSILLYTYSNRPIAVEILSQMRSYNFGAAAAYSVLLLFLITLVLLLSNRIGKKHIPTMMA